MIEQPKFGPLKQGILVTGASGFVGAHLGVSLAQAGHSVIAVSNENTLAKEVKEVVQREVKCDLSDAKSLEASFSAIRPSAIIHAAAFARSALCEKSPEIARKVNIDGTQNLIDYVREYVPSVPFIYISTDLVFDGSYGAEGGFSEEDTPNPCSVYGKTKLEGERVVCEAGLNTWFVLRLSLVYGRKIGNNEGFLSWLRGGLMRHEPVKLFTDEWRTPVFIEDVCLIVNQILAAKLTGDKEDKRSGIFHISGPERINRFDFGVKLATVFGYDKALLQPETQRSSGVSSASTYGLTPRPEDVSLQNEKIVKLLGIAPRDVDLGLRALREWEISHQQILHG